MTWSRNPWGLIKSIIGVRLRRNSVNGLFRDPRWDPLTVRIGRVLACFIPVPNYAVRLHLSFGILSVIPSLILFNFDLSRPPTVVLVLWCINCYGMFAFPYIVWQLLRVAGAPIDHLFSVESSPSRHDFVSTASKYLANRWQALVGLTVGSGAAVVTRLAVDVRPGYLWIDFAYIYVGALVGSSGYLLIITGLLCRQLARTSHLRLFIHQPLDTPGLRFASDAMRRLAQFGLILAFTFGSALAIRYHRAHPLGGDFLPTAITSLVGLAFIVLIGVLSQNWLAAPAAEALRRQLDDLERHTQPAVLDSESTTYILRNRTHVVRTDMSLYMLKTSLKTSYIDANLISAYAATILGVIIQLVLAAIRFS